MKRILLAFAISLGIIGAIKAEERSYSIVFGADNASTTSLTNSTFTDAIKAGKSYVEKVTSVVSVFPETDCIKLSSGSKNGGFNIWLAEDAQVVARRIVVNARRYDNNRDVEASVMLNSETLYVPEVTDADYSLSIPSRPERKLTNLIVDADHRLYINSITVVYDSAQGDVEQERETVAAPVFTPAGGSVSVGTAVEIKCSTEGASIYYTIDGAEPSSVSTLYTEPVVLFNDITLKAFATKDGMDPSEAVSATFRVRNPQASQTSEFNFSDPSTLNPAIAAPALKEWVDLDGRSFTDGDVAITFVATGAGNTSVRLYRPYDADGCDVRLYDGETLTVRSMNPNYVLREIKFEMSLSGAATGSADINFIPSTGEFDWASETWTPAGEDVCELTLTSAMQSRLAGMTVKLDTTSAVRAIELDHDHEAAYYTIQGRRVSASTLQPGLYIRVRGNKADKIVVR